MIYSIKQINKKAILKKIIKILCVATFWILIWEAASRLVAHKNDDMQTLFPGPLVVIKKWWEIAFETEFLNAELFTLLRIFFGFIISVFLGAILGILTYVSGLVYDFLSPVLKIIRSVPVVAIIILLYIVIATNVMPITIVCLMVIPVIWQTTHDSLNNVEKPLLEMASVYKLSYTKTLLKVKLPRIAPQFISSCVNGLGLAWKSGIAAEVLCDTNDSLGLIISQNKISLEYDVTYAVTLNIILLSVIIEYLLKFLCNKYLLNTGGANND